MLDIYQVQIHQVHGYTRCYIHQVLDTPGADTAGVGYTRCYIHQLSDTLGVGYTRCWIYSNIIYTRCWIHQVGLDACVG